MLKASNIAIMGTGTMGPAMARDMLANTVTKPTNITMIGPSQERLDELANELSVLANTNSMDAVAEAEIIILAVKPHLVKAVCQEISPVLNSKDLVTAISGSGSACFYYFIESLTKAGVSLGLPEKIASPLAQQTAYGAIELLKKNVGAQNLEPLRAVSKLRKEVTSPGGTTEAALKTLNTEYFDDSIQHALESALKRAKELSKE